MKPLSKIAILVPFCTIFLSSAAQADNPLFSIVPDSTATTFQIPNNQTQTVLYLVTNNLSGSHTLAMRPIVGVTQTSPVSDDCGSPSFTLVAGASCILNLTVSGSVLAAASPPSISGGPVIYDVNSGGQFQSQPTPANALNVTVGGAVFPGTLSADPTALTLFASSQGQRRDIVITANDHGSSHQTVGAVTYSLSRLTATGQVFDISSQGAGAGVLTNTTGTCGSMTNGMRCTLTINPQNITPAAAGSAAATGTLLITGSETGVQPVAVRITALNYANVYKGGYVFAISDLPSPQAVSGTVAGMQDATDGIPWDGSCEIGTGDWNCAAFSGAVSITDGHNNTSRIVNALSPAQATSSYAASLCQNYRENQDGSVCTSGSCTYEGWYLPAICQMGDDTDSNPNRSGCTQTVNTMSSSLYLNNQNIGNFIVGSGGNYFSSTQDLNSGCDDSDQNDCAWTEGFFPNGAYQDSLYKGGTNPVRCVRDFTG